MAQLQITRSRTTSARRRDELEQPVPLDPRDLDFIRAKAAAARIAATDRHRSNELTR